MNTAGMALLSLVVIFMLESYPTQEQVGEEKKAIIDLRARW